MEPDRDEGPRRSDIPPRVHVNAMAAHGGPFDLTLDFGYRAEADDEPDLQVRVSMSWEHALAMLKALQMLVDGYQAEVGTIPDLTRVREAEGYELHS